MSATSIVMPNDLSDLCRVCLQMPEVSQYLDMTTIYDEDDNLTYSECFTICTRIDLSAGHGLPHQLCKSCGLELQMSYDFHKKVEESKRVLQEYEIQMQEDKTNKEEYLLKPLLQEESLNNEKEQQQEKQETDAQQQLNISTAFSISNAMVEEDHENLSQSEDILPGDGDDQAFLSNFDSDEGEVEADVDLITKISPVKDNKDVEVVSVHVDPMEIEEHLELEDFQNIETLEEETETLQIKLCDENSIQIIKCENNEIQEEDEDGDYYEVEEEDGQELEINYQIDSQELDVEDEDSKWQENVVAVANKEHLPLETEDDDEAEDDTVYAKEKDYVIINEIIDDENDANEEISDEDEQNKKPKRKKQNSTTNNTSSRKRHVGAYTCDYCSKEYANYSRMMAHRRCHESDRPKYPCAHCSRIYSTKQAMDTHIQTTHDNTGYTCDICGKVYAVRKSLEIHVRYHTGDFPYVCDLCGKKFAQVGHLTTHKNVKHNSVRFCCDYPSCGKFFTSSHSLRNHEFTHGLMPFECDYCQLGYPAKSKLRVHIKRKHDMDLNKDQLEKMRKFHVMRSKLNLVKVVEVEQDTETET